MDSDNSSPDALQMGDETQPRCLYVGNLDTSMTEEFLVVLFSQIGPVKFCKIIHEPIGFPYAFIEFWEHHAAATALLAMNKRRCFGKEMKVNWASVPSSQLKQDTSKHYHIFVGDLSPKIDTHALRRAFAPFGEISECRVVCDRQTLKSKGYGFISFVKKSDAEAAIAAMNGQWLGNRSIRTNWAARKPPSPKKVSEGNSKQQHLTFYEVYNRSSPTNRTVYCGGITNGLSEELMQRTFSPFGQIREIRVMKEKGYAFIQFATKESATHAIVAVHKTEINGQTVKCSWGNEAGDPGNVSSQVLLPTPQYGYYDGTVAGAQYPTYGYWYPQGYLPGTAQMQNEFLQGNVGATQGMTSWGQDQDHWRSDSIQQMTGTAAAAYPMQLNSWCQMTDRTTPKYF